MRLERWQLADAGHTVRPPRSTAAANPCTRRSMGTLINCVDESPVRLMWEGWHGRDISNAAAVESAMGISCQRRLGDTRLAQMLIKSVSCLVNGPASMSTGSAASCMIHGCKLQRRAAE